jgi:hypothetical protein
MAIYIKTCIVVVGAGARVRTTPIATSCRITKRRTYVRDRNYNTHHALPETGSLPGAKWIAECFFYTRQRSFFAEYFFSH